MQQQNEQYVLTGPQLRIWNTLRNLPDGGKILGWKLMEVSGIGDERVFHGLIEDMRSAGYQVGADKGRNAGYYEKRTDKHAWDYMFKRIGELENEIEKVVENTENFFVQKYGESFNFIKVKDKEELKRFGEEIEREND